MSGSPSPVFVEAVVVDGNGNPLPTAAAAAVAPAAGRRRRRRRAPPRRRACSALPGGLHAVTTRRGRTLAKAIHRMVHAAHTASTLLISSIHNVDEIVRKRLRDDDRDKLFYEKHRMDLIKEHCALQQFCLQYTQSHNLQMGAIKTNHISATATRALAEAQINGKRARTGDSGASSAESPAAGA